MTAEEVTATVEIAMDDFEFIPKNASAAAGPTDIAAPNRDQVEHELELFKTNEDPGSLAVSDNKADTSPLGEEIEGLEVEPGEEAVATVELEPGTYALICNIPGHYEQGMWGP